ncbi:MAG TPA: glutamate--cysteine ligase [Rubrivivax sp.]|nr:glutamate--cysteine ligase [Burkholderiales bacterium]HNT40080.1 glutamate--cysteine ligase [Rubrivivax sp.]
MSSRLQQRLARLSAERLRGMKRGVEKESLRVLPGNGLALTPHAAALGSALTHPCITTDFSESQIELITGVHGRAADCERELTEIHQFVYRAIGEERLWVASMPCVLPADENIPLGRYGTSNIARAKSVYRMGLSHRYGRRMQTISGIHYNWSLPGLGNEEYFALIRNFRRHSFLLLLLFGASPAVSASFVEGRPHELQPLGGEAATTLYLPYATSLRMGRLGYQSDAQAALAVSYNSLESYASSLHGALTRPHPPYERVGVRNLGGEYNQLATSLLQIENEFYGTIRPKRVIRPGERPLHALRERGVEYVEVRCMDLDPFEPVGISADTMRLLDIFLLHCLLGPSPPDSPQEIVRLGQNQHRTAARGREPGLTIRGEVGQLPLLGWAEQLLQDFEPIAARLAAVLEDERYLATLEQAQAALRSPDMLPSARVLRAVHQEHDDSYVGFVQACSQAARVHLLTLPYAPALQARFEQLAAESLAQQWAIEAADAEPFETFRQQYLAPERLEV